MKSWRANEFGPIEEVLTLCDVDKPTSPRPGAVVLKVITAGVGLPDAYMVKGEYPLVRKTPVSPGQEVVGTVVEVGEGVNCKVGDKVMAISLFHEGSGSFSEYCYATGITAAKIPESMSDEEAAGFVMPFQTAHVALVQRCALKAGETLLVLGGSGSSGSGAIQLGKALGATVIATASGKEKIDFCYSLGADHVIDYRDGPISEQVLKLTKSVDVVFDPVGGDAYTESTKCIARHGRIGLVGYGSGQWANIDTADMVLRSYTAIGAFLGACTPEEVAQAYVEIFDFYSQGKLTTPIDHVYSFDQVPEAIKRIEKAGMLGKLIVRVAEA